MRRLTGLVGAVAFFMVLTAVPVGAGNATGLQWGDGTAGGLQSAPGLTLVDKTTAGVWNGVVGTVGGVWDDGLGTADDVLTLSVKNNTLTTQNSANSGPLCSTAWNPNFETLSITADEIHVCNFDFGNTGWVGLSITWAFPSGEIVVAQVLLNDFFLQSLGDPGNPSIWDTADNRQLVACQEIGHGLGLDHQNGRFKVTCMNAKFGVGDPLAKVPNQHDFDELAAIYSGGGGNGGGGGGGGGGNCPPNSNSPKCQNAQGDFGTLRRIIHIIPAAVPGS